MEIHIRRVSAVRPPFPSIVGVKTKFVGKSCADFDLKRARWERDLGVGESCWHGQVRDVPNKVSGCVTGSYFSMASQHYECGLP